ncbi:hypothetical protein F4779DRAFT_235817 [Xylariaceae sp. FL0662B]|nr:hypothetical protein F4779DRAFT_235817 [Xylariaceae sp. FL0662B]
MSEQVSFSIFPLLPIELRLQVWRHTCHERVVEVFYDSKNDRCATLSTPPAILHACRESRLEGLRIYKRLFGTKSHEARIYFCPDLDTLYLPRPLSMGYDDAARSFGELVTGIDDIVNLAIDYVKPAIRRPWETYNKYTLMHSFPHVKEVYLVLSDWTAAEEDHHQDVGLADPVGDVSDLCRLLSCVKESFTYEIGSSYTIGDAKEEFYEQPSLPPLALKSKVISTPKEMQTTTPTSP